MGGSRGLPVRAQPGRRLANVRLKSAAHLPDDYDIDNVAALETLWRDDRSMQLGKVSLASQHEASAGIAE